MKLIYYVTAGNEVVNCEKVPKGMDDAELEERLRVYNERPGKSFTAIVTEAEDGGLVAYLFGKIEHINKLSEEHISALENALDEAKSHLYQLYPLL